MSRSKLYDKDRINTATNVKHNETFDKMARTMARHGKSFEKLPNRYLIV